jgi:hypothetical protein
MDRIRSWQHYSVYVCVCVCQYYNKHALRNTPVGNTTYYKRNKLLVCYFLIKLCEDEACLTQSQTTKDISVYSEHFIVHSVH